MAEEVAVVQACSPAELPHRLAHRRLDERVDHHRGTAACLGDGNVQVIDDLTARMADDLECLLRKLRLERKDEPCGCLTRGVGNDVQLDRLDGVVHGPEAR